MSYHLHLRAEPADGLRDDFEWLSEFFSAAWDNHPEEVEAGTAESIEKDFAAVHHLYTGVADYSGDSDAPPALPIDGGRVIFDDPVDANPPFLILEPEGVRQAAEFLEAVSFDALWRVAGGDLSAAYRGWDEGEVHEMFVGYHDDLRAFYGKAAAAGHAVAKCFWF